MARLEEQWGIAAGYAPDGTRLSLSEFLDPDVEALPGESLSREQRVDLARARIEAGEWEPVWICEELVERERALRELAEGSELGEIVLEMSEGALAMVLEDARQARREGS